MAQDMFAFLESGFRLGEMATCPTHGVFVEAGRSFFKYTVEKVHSDSAPVSDFLCLLCILLSPR